MIFKPSKKLTFVIYDQNKSPQALRLSKGQLRFLMSSIPFVFAISLLLILGSLAFYRNVNAKLLGYDPDLLEELKVKTKELSLEKETLTTENSDLLKRLKSSKGTGVPSLQLINTPLGSTDLTSKTKAILEQTLVKVKEDKIEVKFNITNNQTNGSKLSGYAFIILKIGNTVQIFPKDQTSGDGHLINYSNGESFTATRFRPVKTSLLRTSKAQELPVEAYVIIYSRMGDLYFSKKLPTIPNVVVQD